jgi:ankyrin repeat protein
MTRSKKNKTVLSNEEVEEICRQVEEGSVELNDPEIPLDNQALLHKAVEENDLELTKDLINKGVDINCKDSDGRTPLFNAVYGGDYFYDDFDEITEFLLNNDADSNIIDKYGRTPLMACVHSPIAKILINHGAKGVDFTHIYYRNSEGAFLIFASDEEQRIIHNKNLLIALLQLRNGILSDNLYQKISSLEDSAWTEFYSEHKNDIDEMIKKSNPENR